MKQFVLGPKDKFNNRRTVNLKEVSNIAFENFINRHGEETWKIIYNFGYSISLKNNTQKKVPDYNYSVFTNKEEYEETVNILEGLVEKGWLAPIVNGTIDRLINPDKISFISRDPSQNRIIINLSASVSFFNDYERMTSDFIFLDFKDEEEYKNNLRYIEGTLLEREF